MSGLSKWTPDRKWLASGLAGVVAWLIILVLNQFNVDVPPDLQAAIPGFVALIIHYAVPASDQDVVKRLDDRLVALAKADPESRVSTAA